MSWFTVKVRVSRWCRRASVVLRIPLEESLQYEEVGLVFDQLRALGEVGDAKMWRHLAAEMATLAKKERAAAIVADALNGSHHAVRGDAEQQRLLDRHRELRPYLYK